MTAQHSPLRGVHHVTALSGEPQRNIDFYTGVLGLRLVKLTVNYDDPGTYHLYYGDGTGSPGTILTFFPWPGAPGGQNGTGMATETVFAAPPASLDYWRARLRAAGVSPEAVEERFGEPTFRFADPDGLRLAVAGSGAVPGYQVWEGSPVPAEHALQGIHSVTLTESEAAGTEEHLIRTMGLSPAGQEGNRLRFLFGQGGAGRIVEVVRQDRAVHGRMAAGTVHHVAWRVDDDSAQGRWQQFLLRNGRTVSPVMDRTYFRSIYWREPGGVLFEIATDPPGFTADEPRPTLGSRLILPSWLEPLREDLQRRLPAIGIPPRPAAKGGH